LLNREFEVLRVQFSTEILMLGQLSDHSSYNENTMLNGKIFKKN